MCGFVGVAGNLFASKDSTTYAETLERVMERMMNRIAHRGPDAAGMFLDNHVAFGFRRLATIDLTQAANQPMSNTRENDTIIVVCDGRIYNFLELKTELEVQGHQFATNSDIEVLIHGYEQWGVDVTKHLRGMFAFALYDREQDILFGARDCFGVKPFYYTRLADGNLLFGSEIKSFLDHPDFKKELNTQALKPYLTFQYNALEETFFKGVFRLPQAHRFIFQLETKEMNLERYWDADFTQALPPAPGAHRSFEECVERLDRAVNQSVALCRVADVEVAAFLSGGVDSSYIVSSFRPAKTFSVGFDIEGFDETTHAQALCAILGIENYRCMLDPADAFEAFSTIQYHTDEPASNPSVVPLYFLAKLASEHVKVVLSGEGSDEFFAGYGEYRETPPTKMYKRLVPAPLRRALSTLVEPLPHIKGRAFLRRGSGRPEDYFIGQAFIFDEDEAKSILKPAYRCAPSIKEITAPIYARVADWDELSKKQYLDLNLWMPNDICLKADKMTMAHSLEIRSPLTDKLIMDEAQSTPPAYRITEENDKFVLRTAAARTIPEKWANRVKIGFLTPVRVWLKEEHYCTHVRELFASEMASEFFDREKLLGLLDANCKGTADNGRKIWTVYTFLIWYQRFFVDEAA